MARTLLQELYVPFSKSSKKIKIIEMEQSEITLGKVCKIGTNMEDADFWIQRKGDSKNVGSVSKKFDAEKIGVKITNAGYDSKYIYYVLMHLHNSGYFKNKAKGSLKLQHISVSDVKNISLHKLTEAQMDMYGKNPQIQDNNHMNPQNDDDDLWHPGNIKQEFDSAKTSLNQVASSFKTILNMGGWQKGAKNIDIGSGRAFIDENGQSIHKFSVALRSVGVINVEYDPFNRSFEHNNAAAKAAKNGQCDTATVNNVLNVINSSQNRLRVIRQAHNALKDDGTAYFLIYEGDRTSVGKDKGQKRWQNNMRTEEYMPEIHHYFPYVKKKGNLIIARKVQ